MFHDGCTAGPLSDWLNGWIGACCDAHDLALDHSYDLGTFIAANLDWIACATQANSWVAVIGGMLISGPIGLALYFFGPKRKSQPLTLTIRGSGLIDTDSLVDELTNDTTNRDPREPRDR